MKKNKNKTGSVLSNEHPDTAAGQNQAERHKASILRILAAWLYDGMLLFSILLLASAVYILPLQLSMPVDASTPHNLSVTRFTGPLFYSFLFFISYFFFAWFWTHGGQTLGLRAWSLRVESLEGKSISWTQSLLRFLAAAAPWIVALFIYDQLNKAGIASPGKYFILLIGFGGLLWGIIDSNGRTLQDIFSASRIVRLPGKRSS